MAPWYCSTCAEREHRLLKPQPIPSTPPLFLSGVYFSHKTHLEVDIATSAHPLNSSSVFLKMDVFNQLEEEQALVSFVSPKYKATSSAA